MQFGSRESLEDHAARKNREMTLVEMLRNPQRVDGGTLDTSFNERVMVAAAARLDKLEIALTTIVGHGNITVERAKQVAAEALAD